MKPLFTTLAIILSLQAYSQSIINPKKPRYQTPGKYKPLDTVTIYNRKFVLRSYAYALSNGGQPLYAAQAINSPDGLLVIGKVYSIPERSIIEVRRYKK